MTYRPVKYSFLFAVCCFLVLIAYGGPKGFWETKPFTEWSAKEVEKLLLKDSPWTQTLLLDTPGGGGSAITSTGSAGGGRGGAGAASQQIIINWFARPIREATARQLMLQKPDVTKAQLNPILNRKD